MKPTDLRSGNIVVKSKTGELFQITGSNIANFEASVLMSPMFLPVKLTEEWLIKFGLKANSDKTIFDFIDRQWDDYTILFYDNQWWLYYCDATAIDKPIEYVHQLQNLYFALTGEELTL